MVQEISNSHPFFYRCPWPCPPSDSWLGDADDSSSYYSQQSFSYQIHFLFISYNHPVSLSSQDCNSNLISVVYLIAIGIIGFLDLHSLFPPRVSAVAGKVTMN